MIYFFSVGKAQNTNKKNRNKKTPKNTMGGKKTQPRKYQKKLRNATVRLTKHPPFSSKPRNLTILSARVAGASLSFKGQIPREENLGGFFWGEFWGKPTNPNKKKLNEVTKISSHQELGNLHPTRIEETK